MDKSLGNFVKVKKGVVCYRDKNGNFTDKKVDLYAEVPASDINAKTSLTRRDEKACETAAANVFAPMFKKYIDANRSAGFKY